MRGSLKKQQLRGDDRRLGRAEAEQWEEIEASGGRKEAKGYEKEDTQHTVPPKRYAEAGRR